MLLEKRTYKTEIRMIPRESGHLLEGHAAVYGVLSEDLGGFRERLLTGAFNGRTEDDVRALFNHVPSYILGRTAEANTLRLSTDDSGLYYEVDLPDTSYARDLLVAVARKDITQSSFSFIVNPEGERWYNDGGETFRDIRQVAQLYDVSPVTFPAYTETSAAVLERALSLYPNLQDHQQRAAEGDQETDPGAQESEDPRPDLVDIERRRLGLWAINITIGES